MLVVADEDSAEPPADTASQPEGANESTPTKNTQQHLAESIAQHLRERSAALHDEMQLALRDAVDDDTEDEFVSVPIETLRGWAADVHELNRGIGAQSRVSAQRLDRLNVELSLMHTTMLSDLLDREATHTHTIEEIIRVGSNNEVGKAMRIVHQLHGGTSNLTTDAPLSYFGAATCAADAPDAVAGPS